MKKFKFTIHGNPYEVEIKNFDEGLAQIEVNGTNYDIEVHQQKQATKTPKLVRSVVKTPDDPTKGMPSDNVTKVTAPLPGNILHVHKTVGAAIVRGELVITYEAMKMENKVLAEKDGVIESMKVKVGDSVLQGDLLFVIK